MDKEKDNLFWEKLGKLTSGEASEQERKEVDRQLEGNEGNIQYMMSVLGHYWESVQELPDPIAGSTAWSKISGDSLKKVATMQRSDLPGNSLFRSRKLWAAAVLILVVAGGWLAWHTFILPASEMNVVSTRNGSKTKITLPDGTQVWLNADSRLSYPNDFQHTSERNVTLSGEAYFEVKHHAERPFIIHTQYLDIKDIGTTFNVKAYPDEKESEATLISGSIQVFLHKDPNKNYILKPKEKIIYYADHDGFSLNGSDNKIPASPAADSLCKVPANAEVVVTRMKNVLSPSGDSIVAETAWINNQLVFDSEKFSDLAKRMERWYNVKFEIKDKKIGNYIFTGIFDGETLEQALEELQMIRPFQFSMAKEKVIINN